MKNPFRARGPRAYLTLAAACTAALGAGAAAQAAIHVTSAAAPSGCTKVHGPARVGRFAGIIHAQRIGSQAPIGGDSRNGPPPLIWHGGRVMEPPNTGPVVVTPIFWNPPGHAMSTTYKNIITQYLTDVAAASGSHTNVYSTMDEYFGS